MLLKPNNQHDEVGKELTDIITVKDFEGRQVFIDIEIQYQLVDVLTDVNESFDIEDAEDAKLISSVVEIALMYLYVCKITPNRARPITIKMPLNVRIVPILKHVMTIKGINII